ncbi:peptidoglycan-binding protein [Streptomyces sp. CA-132043]|uniref:peptidoglycan-binding domain-containing protein n=1 Tax=Streptomyces sp. CA-132043 TaxID=3240048 RepID=UPI003D902ADD
MTARNCPTCLAPARTGGHPGCRCEQAAAQDFDPLHIRPYVSLPDAPDPDDPPQPPRRPRAFTVRAYGPPAFPPPSYVRVPRPPYAPPRTAQPPAAPPGESPTAHEPPAAAPHLPLYAPQSGGAGTGPGHRRSPGRRPDGLPVAGPVAFMDPPGGEIGQAGDRSEPERRRRPVLLAGLMVTAAAGSVCAALFGGELHAGGGAGDVLADRGERPVADLPDGAVEARPTDPGAASRSATRLPGARAAASAAETPFTRPPDAPTTRSAERTREEVQRFLMGSDTGPAVLSEGASGPGVTELQRRLAQLKLYAGPADGRYDAGVAASVARYQRTYGETGDPYGVYGSATRTSLEFLTDEP